MGLKRLLSIVILAAVLLTSSQAFGSLTDGLVAWYTLNGDTMDHSGKANHGGGTSAVPVEDRFGTPESAYFFNGNDEIYTPSDPSMQVALPVTISAWVKLNTSDAAPIFLNNYVGGHYHGVWLTGNANNKISIGFGDGGGGASGDRRSKAGATILELRTWYHVVGIIRGPTDMDIFINGVNDGGSYSGTGGALAYKSVAWGRIGLGYSGNLNGEIDDLRFYNRALTEDEILALYEEREIDLISSFIQNPENSNWYRLFEDKWQWHEAKAFCQALGGNLATISSEEENAFLHYNLSSRRNNLSIGGTDELSEGIWEWITGETWNYTNWAPSQPDAEYESHDYLSFDSDRPNAWNDDSNAALSGFICEWNDLDDLANIIQKTDMDNDGDTDGLDLAYFIAAYGSASGELNYNPEADFDDDGDVDDINLITFAHMFGGTDTTRILSTVPVLDQCDYQNTFVNPNGGYPENACAGCVPTSMAMLLINIFNVHSGFNLEIPGDDYEDIVLDIANNLIDDIQGGSVQVDPDSLPLKMSDYTMIVDADETDGLYEQIEWTMAFPELIEKSNDEWITFIRNRLMVG